MRLYKMIINNDNYHIKVLCSIDVDASDLDRHLDYHDENLMKNDECEGEEWGLVRGGQWRKKRRLV